MLAVLRERALELLPDSEPLRARHAAHYLELAERSEPGLKGPDQAAWGERLQREHDNVRAALGHADPLVAVRIAAALGFFWYTHGYSAEGISHLERTLAAAGGAPPLVRGRALQALGILRSQRGDAQAEATFVEALAMFRATGDQERVPVALNPPGIMARGRGEMARGGAGFGGAAPLYPPPDDRGRLADVLSNLAIVAVDQDRLDDAATLFA